MSGPPSDSRHSLSSEPSQASSHTLNSNSRHSGVFEDNGEGSSSQKHSLAGSRTNSTAWAGVSEVPSKDPMASLGPESIGEQDFVHRKHRSRRSGGFLLDSRFPSDPTPRQPNRHSTHSETTKAKRSSRHHHQHDGHGLHARTQSGNGISSHSSPLSRELVMAEQDTAQDKDRIDSASSQPNNGELRLPKTRKSARAISPAAHIQDPVPPRAAIDPNQIVHMALNLSESRRRNLSAGQLIAPQPTGSRRVASITPQQDHSTSSSLRQYLNEQRRVSRNISPFGGRSSPSRNMSTSMHRSMSMAGQGQQIIFSEATMARRDKARAYIELRIQYLRLLEYLPPLKPDASAPGNFIVTANNVPGSHHAYLTRTPSYAGKKHDLGRPYNPLQYIRNRKIRARERRSLDHTPEEFLDVDQVREWVNRVEKHSQYPDYRRQDSVALPKFHEDHTRDGGPTKPSRPRMGWIFTSEELLADAHWLEQEDNKTVIEDRHGRKIFPPKEPQKQDLLAPRASKEYPEKRRKSWVEGLPGLSGDPTTADESDPTSERGRKRRLLPAFRAESPKHKKHGWRGSATRTGYFSDSSDSGCDSQRAKIKRHRKGIDDDNSTGPLGLHLKKLMDKEGIDPKSISPAIVSPDTPDKWGKGHANIHDSETPRSSLDVPGRSNGSVKDEPGLGLKMPPRSRTNGTLALDHREPRSSFEDLDSTAPNTPLHVRHFPHIGSDLSPLPSRGNSVKKSKKSRLDNLFRSDESTKIHKHEPDSAGTDKKKGSRQTSEEVSDGTGLGTAILAAPSAVKSLLPHKKDGSIGSLTSPEQRKELKELRDSREPSSAVHRFFKGVKNEGSKMGEFIFRRDRPAEDSDTDSTASDRSPNQSDSGEDTTKQGRRSRPRVARSATASSIASNRNSRYHLDLPSFRSHNDPDASDSHLSDDHVSRQARATANNRSPRFEKLAPPRMDLRSISVSSRDDSRAQSEERLGERMNKILARPGGVGAGGLPMNPLARPRVSISSSRQNSHSRPRLEKRHWSITDDSGGTNMLHHKATANIVSRSDIARIRALFLCSGVKAQEIARRAHEKRATPHDFLTRAATTAQAKLIPVRRMEEHVLAARILVTTLESSTQSLQRSTEDFRENTIKELTATINTLKSTVEADLFSRVRSSGDEAVRITSEVSGNAPLSVKQVSDEIDKMIRMRRRRMRWVRRVGWMLVEWALVGVMWWLWLVVVVLGSVRRVLGLVFGVVRWLLWL